MLDNNMLIVVCFSGALLLILILFLILNINTMRRCTYPVKGVLDHYNEEKRTSRSRESGISRTTKYYVPIYKYSVNGNEFTARGKESTSKEKLPPIGDVREFLVDPKNPKIYNNVTIANLIANVFAIIFVVAVTIYVVIGTRTGTLTFINK